MIRARDSRGRDRLIKAIVALRLTALAAALCLWAAWSSAVFWSILGLALAAGGVSVALSLVLQRVSVPARGGGID